MSWLSDIASKTESLLNSLDRGAASALKKPSGGQSAVNYDSSRSYSKASSALGLTPAATIPASQQSSRQSTPTGGRRRPTTTAAPSAGAQDTEERLIAFLNDATPIKTSSNHSRQSSVSSVASVGAFLSLATGGGSGGSEQPTHATNAAPDAASSMLVTDTKIAMPTGGASGVEEVNLAESDQVRMLQREVQSLNREVAQIMQRAKLSEKEGIRLKYQLTLSGDQLAEAEKQCRYLQQRESDMTETLQSKDGQLAVLKVRLDEADGELRSRQGAIDRLQLENDRILQSSSDASGLQSGTIQGLQDRLQEAEARHRQQQQQMQTARQEHDRRTEQLTAERGSLTSELSAARQQLQQLSDSCAELHRQLAEQHAAADAAERQLTEYKLKAQRILLSKDQLIADLKGESVAGVAAVGSSERLRDAQLEQLRAERELAQTEVHQLAATVQHLREELQQAEAGMQEEASAAAQAEREAAAREATDRHTQAELQRELQQNTQELSFLREEMVRQKTQALSRLQQRDEEIEKLRRQITSKHVATSTEVELESRLRSLTENLIQKQTNIETLTTQNRSLSVQLERAQSQLAEPQGGGGSGGVGGDPASDRVLVLDDRLEPLRHRPAPVLFAETPWDGTVTRRVKRAYSSLDACSVRLGLFLKRYPIARIFVIGYMCMLHLWVMLVLFTYTPEIHGDGYHHQPDAGLPSRSS